MRSSTTDFDDGIVVKEPSSLLAACRPSRKTLLLGYYCDGSAPMEPLGVHSYPSEVESSTVVPSVALQWVISYATTSNVELASLANVHSSWRRLVQRVLLDIAAQSTESVPVASLLLPSMLTQRMWEREGDCADDTFCVAWFAPEGIQTLKLDVDGDDDEASAKDDEQFEQATDSAIDSMGGLSVASPPTTTGSVPVIQSRRSVEPVTMPVEPFAPNGHTLYQPNEDDTKDRRNQRSSRRSVTRGSTNRSGLTTAQSLNSRSSQPSVDSECVVCPEWRGYQSPWQVLRPFGYSKTFLDDLLAVASTRTSHRFELPQPGQPTFAVRGASLARPEGYCCCMDLVRGHRSSSWMSQRRDLQRDVLPRVLRLSPTNGSSPRPQTAVQFLNASGSHAVCMITPPFVQPLREPLTILLVGIATEDGCFVSGLRHRMEVGHLYPRSPDMDWSGVCLAAAAGYAAMAPSPALPYRFSSDDDGDDTSQDDDADRDECKSKPRSNSYTSLNSLKCRCAFANVASKFDRSDGEWDDDDDQDPDVETLESCRIHRGQTGPGQWRCYTAIFDGHLRSQIRVDGIPETISLQSPTQDDRRRRPSQVQLEPMLDGLTIGSDHCFGMSLCCGFGSGGEGEGAIAEFVVFKGHLDDADLRALENDLMQRHGIPLSSQHPDDRNRESEWIRLSYALYAQTRLSDEEAATRVPLRIMTKHPTVAWNQTNPVSGEQVSIPRIGVRHTQACSSSDW